MTGQDFVVLLGLIASALIAGLFFAWEVAVIPGLAETDDRSYLQAMQQINRAIVNPVFLLPFLLTPVLLVAAGQLASGAGDSAVGRLFLVAAAVYGIGVLGVTFARNVPLNNELDGLDLTSVGETLAAARSNYEGQWNRWNRVRAVAAGGSIVLVGLAVLNPFAAS